VGKHVVLGILNCKIYTDSKFNVNKLSLF